MFLGGTNSGDSYGIAYVTNNLTNFSVTGEFSAVANAYGLWSRGAVEPGDRGSLRGTDLSRIAFHSGNKLKVDQVPRLGTTFAVVGTVAKYRPMGTNVPP